MHTRDNGWSRAGAEGDQIPAGQRAPPRDRIGSDFLRIVYCEGELTVEKVAIPPARVMRIIWFGFVLSGVMLIYIVVTIPDRAPGPMGPAVQIVLTVVALAAVALGFVMPRILRRAAGRARERQRGPSALNAWFRDNLVGLAWIYSCNLFAFVLHFFRARVGLVEILFAIGMISLLLWQPGSPPLLERGKGTRG